MESKELLSTMMKLPLKKLKLKVIFYLPPSLLSFLLSNCFQKVRPPIPPDDLAKNTTLKKLQLGLRDSKQSQKLVLPLPSPLFCLILLPVYLLIFTQNQKVFYLSPSQFGIVQVQSICQCRGCGTILRKHCQVSLLARAP